MAYDEKPSGKSNPVQTPEIDLRQANQAPRLPPEAQAKVEQLRAEAEARAAEQEQQGRKSPDGPKQPHRTGDGHRERSGRTH